MGPILIAVVRVVDTERLEKDEDRIMRMKRYAINRFPPEKSHPERSPKGGVEGSMASEGREDRNRTPEHGTQSVPEGRSHAAHGNEFPEGGRRTLTRYQGL